MRRAPSRLGAAVGGALLCAGGAHAAGKDAKYPRKYDLQPVRCEDGTLVLPYAAPTRAENLKRLRTETFDVVVVGGGCVGAGVAWEAATRGLKVALVEREDFSSGTSGRSTKLIHGGIRYLEAAFTRLDKGSFDMVSEALSERAHLLNAAPYMAHPLATLIPVYTWWELPYLWAGAKLYDLIAGSRRAVPSSFHVSREEAMYQFPMLDASKLRGGIVYYDGQHNDTRMNLMIVLTAAQAGATVGNYVTVDEVVKDAEGRSVGVAVRDVKGADGSAFLVRAKAVVNATGCFGDAIRQLDNPAAVPLIQGASGVHLVLPDHFSPDNMGLIVPKTRDGRVLFFLPWEGSTIVGTTDSPADISMEPKATEEEVSFIIEEANRFLTRKIAREDVKSAWSGIRPLIKDPSKLKLGPDGKPTGTSALTRSHVCELSPSGMVSILGGKWTTYRAMAEEAVDAVAKLSGRGLPEVGPSRTQSMQLLGADRAGIVINQKYERIPITLRESYGFEKDVAKHLSMSYGTRAVQVAEIARAHPPLAARLHPRYPFLAAEVVFAAEFEYAMTAVDVLARRTRLAFLNAAAAREATPEVVRLLGEYYGWGSGRRREEAERTLKFIEGMDAPPPAVGPPLQWSPSAKAAMQRNPEKLA
jgi:glycerol-3-phosphate dehydrogenase